MWRIVKLFTITSILSFCGISGAELVHSTVNYKDQGQAFEGYVVYDSAITGARPGILVTHDWLGLTNKTKERADQLASLGYVAFAVDVYGKGVRPAAETAGQEAGKYKSDRNLFRKRMLLGLNQLKEQKLVDKKRLAVIGYCFGGTGAIELARAGANLKAAVSFHGGLDSPDPKAGKNIKAKVLALHGADDPFVAANDLSAFESEMRENRIDWQLIKYGGAVHSFTDKSAGTDNSKGAAYNESADRRSWQAMVDFFKENL